MSDTYQLTLPTELSDQLLDGCNEISIPGHEHLKVGDTLEIYPDQIHKSRHGFDAYPKSSHFLRTITAISQLEFSYQRLTLEAQ